MNETPDVSQTSNARYLRARYAAQRQQGECAYHKGRAPVPGTARCVSCTQAALRARKGRYQRAKAQGRCVDNPAHKARPGRILCATCAAKRRQQRRRHGDAV